MKQMKGLFIDKDQLERVCGRWVFREYESVSRCVVGAAGYKLKETKKSENRKKEINR